MPAKHHDVPIKAGSLHALSQGVNRESFFVGVLFKSEAMMQARILTISLTLVALASAARVGADPISVTYTVQVTQRCLGNSSCSPFSPAAFPLTMSFDSAITLVLSDAPNEHQLEYGPPSFSLVPLAFPQIPSGAQPDVVRTDEVTFRQTPGGTRWFHNGSAADFLALRTPQFDFHSGLVLNGSEVGLLEKATLSPQSFVALLGRPLPGNSPNFLYFFDRINNETFERNPEDVRYLGFATIEGTPAPTPEPGSFGLVGLSLMIAFRVAAKRTSITEKPLHLM